MSAIVAIPARLKSVRFPRKVLADICGKPMLWHVFQGVSQAKSISEVWVLSDSQEVVDQALSWGANSMLTSEDCPTGTDRIASVIGQLQADIIVNVQGDEPLIRGEVVDALVSALERSRADVATPVYRLKTMEELNNPNVVKVARALDGTALYFSRSPIPHLRDVEPTEWLSKAAFWGHAGVYAFGREVLEEFSRIPLGSLETMEKLEQLRLLEAGKRFISVELEYRPQAVDVPEDLERVVRIINETGHGY